MTIPRVLWSLLALALLGFAIFESVKHGWLFGGTILAAAILPDVALIGAFDPGRPGRLRPSRVAFYNLLHNPWLPVVTMLVGIVFSALAFVAGCAWLLHIAIDRVAGYGPREPDGSIRSAHRAAAGSVAR
ncbi:DUF4260 family protein [Microbacterium sp. bgisy189]|uniref:DUF4260 family protein n=1 Tax=Microbacterium sp. bgisy189 TaxID=3413798 RepID=UPI003EB95CB0